MGPQAGIARCEPANSKSTGKFSRLISLKSVAISLLILFSLSYVVDKLFLTYGEYSRLPYKETIAQLRAEHSAEINSLNQIISDAETEQALATQQYGIELDQLKKTYKNINARHIQLIEIIAQARKKGLIEYALVPMPKPDNSNPLRQTISGLINHQSFDEENTQQDPAALLRGALPILDDLSARNDELLHIRSDQDLALNALNTQITIENDQLIEEVQKLAKFASIKWNPPGLGGPFIPVSAPENFYTHLQRLLSNLELHQGLKKKLSSFPTGHPLLKKIEISSKYGYRRDPFNGRQAMHQGLDFSAKTGTLVYSTAPGRVAFSGRRGGYGRVIEIKHKNGLTTRYAHLNRSYVKTGQRIKARQKIGSVGNSGRSTGSHLHYEVRRGGTALNPSPFFQAKTHLLAN